MDSLMCLACFSQASVDQNALRIATVDLGLSCRFTDNLQRDGGVNVGVTRSADDLGSRGGDFKNF